MRAVGYFDVKSLRLNTLRYLFLFFVVFVSHQCLAQDVDGRNGNSRHSSGLFLSMGGQALLDVDYRYLVYSLQAEYRYVWKRKGSWLFQGWVQPQASLTRFNFEDDGPVNMRGHEFGVGLGFLAERSFSAELFSVYMGAGTGPCFLSKGTHRQTDGVAFNSQLFCGMTIRLDGTYNLDVRTGYRHVSNAGLSQPNGGLNNSMLSVGVFRRF